MQWSTQEAENTCLKELLGGTAPERAQIPTPTKAPTTPDFKEKVEREKEPLDPRKNWAKIMSLEKVDANNRWENLQDHQLERQLMQS